MHLWAVQQICFILRAVAPLISLTSFLPQWQQPVLLSPGSKIFRHAFAAPKAQAVTYRNSIVFKSYEICFDVFLQLCI